MIETKGIELFYRWFFRLFCVLFMSPSLLALFSSFSQPNFIIPIVLVGFSLIPIFFLYLFKRHYNKMIIKVETEDNFYKLTLLNKKVFLLDPDSVIKVWHNEKAYMLVLDNGLKFYIPIMIWWTKSRNPWKPFLTEKRFPNAEFKYNLFFW